MTSSERLAAAWAALPAEARAAAGPALRLLVHDINGLLSPITMEAFVVAHITASSEPSQPLSAEQLATLAASAQNLTRAAQEAVSYLAQVQALAGDRP